MSPYQGPKSGTPDCGGNVGPEWLVLHTGTRQTEAVRTRHLAALVRAARTTLVVPILFTAAFVLIGQPEMAGFAVFGTFAHLLLVEYDPRGRARCPEAGLLTGAGAIAILAGALLSANMWLAVGGAVLAGCLTELSVLRGGRLAAVRTAVLLAFVLSVAAPTSPTSVAPYLAGWLLAGAVAQPVLLWLWVPVQGAATSGDIFPVERSVGIASAVWTGIALGAAVLFTRVLHVQHGFWVVLGVLPILSSRAAAPSVTFGRQIGGTVLGCCAGAALVTIVGGQELAYWFVLPVTVFAAAYASTLASQPVAQAGFALFAIVLFRIIVPDQTDLGTLRIADIAIGGTLALCIVGLRRVLQRRTTPQAVRAGTFTTGCARCDVVLNHLL